MRTSEQVYHQICWDPRLDPARFVVGVQQRGAPPKRVALPAFTPGGEVPWHRVLFVEADGELVWDRVTGLDHIGKSTAGRARTQRRLHPPVFTASTPHAWNPASGWAPAEPRSTTGTAAVRVLTWNVLWDRYDGDRIDTARRRPLLLTELAAADADVIALQEVEPDLLTALMAQPWVRESYTLDVDPTGPDVDRTGLVMLSRLPVLEAGRFTLSQHKAVSAIIVETGADPLVVANTHLTSDHTPDGPAKRRAQLARVAEALAGLDGDVVLVGDFNDGGPRPAETLGMRDAWLEARDDAPPTFDPVANPLAALSSLSGRPARLDRVFLRGRLGCVEAGLLGTQPATAGVFASDHYGVLTRVEPHQPPATGQLRWFDEPAASLQPSLDAAAEQVASTLTSALDVVHVVGSRRMGCALPDADLDLIAVGSDPATVAARVLAVLPGSTTVRPVVGARSPGLRLTVDGLNVDLAVVDSTDGDGAEVTLSAVTDAEAVLAAVDARADAFARLAREVKAWARARGLDSAPFGGVPGLAWAVLAAKTVREWDGPDLLTGFFATWAAWDWRDPVGLLTAPEPTGAPVTIMTPTTPVRSCTEHIGPGFRDLLTAELYRAWEIVESAGEGLLDPPQAHRSHAAWAVLTVPHDLIGPVRGRMRALLTALEAAGTLDAHAWPRPIDHGPDTVRFAIGLGRQPLLPAALTEMATAWKNGLPGVEVVWVSNDEVPTL